MAVTRAMLRDPVLREQTLNDLAREIVIGLSRHHMIQTWVRDNPRGWILVDKTWSPIYVTFRLLPSAAPQLYKGPVTDALTLLLRDADFIDENGVPRPHHKVVGVAMAGICLANAMTMSTGIPSLYTRKLMEDVKTDEQFDAYLKTHGGHSQVEGEMEDGDVYAIVDDLATRFRSKHQAGRQIYEEARRKHVKVKVSHVIIVLDREQGAAAEARKEGYILKSVVHLVSKGLNQLQEQGTWSEMVATVVRNYFAEPEEFQREEVKADLVGLARSLDEGVFLASATA